MRASTRPKRKAGAAGILPAAGGANYEKGNVMVLKAGFLVSGIFSLLLAAGCGGSAAGAHEGHSGSHGNSAGGMHSSDQVAQKTCPVMGNPIDKNIYVDYKGRRIYFCCKACISTFNKNPEKYLKIVDAELKSGK